MANEMLMGLLNQTSGGNWWQGTGAPTSGYGSFTPPPAQPQQAGEAPPPPSGESNTGGITPPSVPAPGSSVQDKRKKQNTINMVNDAQAMVLQRQQELQSAIQQNSQYPSISAQHRVNSAQQNLFKAQQDLQKWQAKLAELGY